MRSALTYRAEDAGTLNLGSLRRLLGVSQTSLANHLRVSQPCIAQLENQDDMHLSTLRRHIEALGGELELLAHFPGQRIEIALTQTAHAIPKQPTSQPKPGSTSC